MQRKYHELALFVVLGASLPFPAQAEPTVTCVGSKDAPRRAIFLRGITADVGPSENWRLSRFNSWSHSVLSNDLYFEKSYYEQDLAQIGRELGIRFALVESDRYCPGSLSARCWTGDEPSSIAATYATVVEASKRCFPVRPDDFGLIGFSNGGYHVDRVVMQCLAPAPRWAIAIGSAGDPKLAGEDLKGCTRRLTLAAGDLDITREKAHGLASALGKHRLDVRFVEFYGGHEVPMDVLRDLLSQQP
jgi:dienelactone hydrolase